MKLSNVNLQELQARIEKLEQENADLQKRADQDDLTGCLRRSAFFSLIERRKSFGLLPKNMTLAVVDIDHFKKINDQHGHAVGDKVLEHIAQILREEVPEGSLVCRMGGEEFTVIMPLNIESGALAMEQLRKKIEEEKIEISNSKFIAVTASFGVADWNSDTHLIEASIKADAVLYKAKNSGRNLVLCA